MKDKIIHFMILQFPKIFYFFVKRQSRTWIFFPSFSNTNPPPLPRPLTTASPWLRSTSYVSNQPAGAYYSAYRLAVATFAGIQNKFGLHLP